MTNKILPFLFILIGVLIGCEFDTDTYTPTEFFIKNNCDTIIDVYGSALVRQSDVYAEEGYIEKSIHDKIFPDQLLSYRRISINSSKDFKIKDIFTKIEIFKGKIKTKVDAMDKSHWIQNLESEKKDEFTLIIDSTFFKN